MSDTTTVTAALARVRAHCETYRAMGDDAIDDDRTTQATFNDLRTLLALAEAALEETRAEDEMQRADRMLRGELMAGPRAKVYVPLRQTSRAAAAHRARARNHRRALARGEG